MIQMMEKREGLVRVYISVETEEPIVLSDEMTRSLDDGFALIVRAFTADQRELNSLGIKP